jgi:hypothetical protein
MKKFGLALLISLTLAGYLFPPFGVLAVDKPYLTVVSFTGDPDPADTQGEVVAEYTGTNNGVSLSVRQECDGANCWKTDYFVMVRATVSYTVLPAGHSDSDITMWFNAHGDVDHYEYFTCPGGESGTCTAYGYYTIPASEVTNFYASSHAIFNGNVGASGHQLARNWDITITISTTPIDTTECDETYTITSLVSAGTIDATDEDGISETLSIGQQYRLHVFGGPWNDGSADRYDSALDLGDGWTALSAIAADEAIVDCVQNDEDDFGLTIFWEATAEDFAIRVNDIAAAFADNTGGLDYSLYTVEESAAGGCSGQFLDGTLLATINVNSTNSSGYTLTMPPLSRALKAGEWINVQVYSGSWTEAGGAAKTDLEINSAGGIYWPMENWFYTGCSENDNNYVQIFDNSTLRIRADDTDANWGNNSGTMVIRIYAATYDRYPTGCELTYTIGDEIESKIVSASSSTGIRMLSNTYWDPSPWAKGGEGIRESNMRYFVIDVTGGPFWDGQNMSVINELSVDGGQTWYVALGSVPGVVCVVATDEIGHVRIILEETVDPQIQFRVFDPGDGYGNNSGTLGYTLYEARGLQIYQPGTALQPGTCDDEYFYDNATGVLLTMQGASSLGYPLPLIEAGNIYALQTSAGPWTDLVTGKYTIAISDDAGVTWTELSNYDYLLCGQSDDGNHVLAYIRAEEGRDYRVRVNDGDGNFANNSDSIDLTVYEADTYIDPWHSCADAYTLTEMDIPLDQRKIPAQMENGGSLPDLQSGQIYAVEASISPWIDALSHEYFLTDISSDDGTTWVAMADADQGGAPLAACVVQVGSASSEVYRVYFTANGGGYRLRSSGDGNTNFILRGGYVTYRIYSAVDTDQTPEDDDNGNGLPPLWASACYETCQRPTWVFAKYPVDFGTLGNVEIPYPDVINWIEYGRCAIQKYFAWCPEHTAALVGLMDDFNERDPFATFLEVEDGFRSIQEQLASLSTGGEEVDIYRPYSVVWGSGGGEFGGSVWDGVVPIIPDTSIWTGGELDLTATGGELPDSADYIAHCETAFEPFTGEMVNGFCPVLAIVRNFQTVWVGLQLILDIGMIIVLIKYIKRAWIDRGVAG